MRPDELHLDLAVRLGLAVELGQLAGEEVLEIRRDVAVDHGVLGSGLRAIFDACHRRDDSAARGGRPREGPAVRGRQSYW